MNTLHAGDSRSAWILVVGCLAIGLVLGFLLGRFGASDPDTAPDQTGSGVVWGASSPAPNRLNSRASLAPTARTTVADVANDPAQLFSSLRSRTEAAKASGNPFRNFAELAPFILALREEQIPGALEMVDNLDSRSKSLLIPTLFLRWAETDPEGAMSQAESMLDPASKGLALQGVLQSWSESDPESAWNYLNAREESREQSRMISDFVSIIAASDPRKAAQFAARIDDLAARNKALMSVSYQWGSNDPAAAYAWAESLGDESLARTILPGLVGSIARKNPEHAFDLALRSPDSVSRQSELGQVIHSVAQSDLAKAFELLDRVPEGVDATGFALSISKSRKWGSASLEKIDDYLERIDDATARNQILQSAVQMKANQGATAEAEQLLAQIPEGKVRNRSFRVLAGSWSSNDPGAAQDWLDQVPPGDERDFAITGLSRVIVRSDPQGALAWAASIDTETVRAQTISSLSRQWLSSDRAAAAPWIQASDTLTPEQKHRLLVTGLQ
jgi:hypothetical protein